MCRCGFLLGSKLQTLTNSVKCGRKPKKTLVELEFRYVLSNYYFQGQKLTFTYDGWLIWL